MSATPVASAKFKTGGALVNVNLETSFYRAGGTNYPLASMAYQGTTQPPVDTTPAAPATFNLSVPTGTTDTIVANWTAAVPQNGGPAVDSYRLINKADGSVFSTVANVLTKTVTGLPSATPYTLQVQGHNASGWGPLSLARSATTGTGSSGTNVPLLGIYHGGPTTDDDVRTQFGSYPDCASSYYNSNQSGLSVTAETARIRKGISPVVTLTTQGTTYLADLAAGSGSAGYAAASSWLNNYVNALHTLSLVDPKITVYAAFCHEWTIQVSQGQLTGASALPANYGLAMSEFVSRCRATAPLVKTLLWTSSMNADVNTAMQNMTSFPHVITADPYSIKPGVPGTPSSTWATFINSLRLTSGAYHAQWVRLGSPALGITETAIASVNKTSGTAVLANTDDAMATWYSGIRQALADNDLELCIMFNRNSGKRGDYALHIPDSLGNSHPKAKAMFGAQLAAPQPAAV